ncbi:hypothetical protein J6590_077519 [Homalodisca vitripennis]|nr:hypothetical protein J6590_077519 [Homalodisca vitripennis]
MSAGVAVIFSRNFNKPTTTDRVGSQLTYQQIKNQAGVYGLITKPKYYEKPTPLDYEVAFQQFADDFKRKDFKRLICSPMGCMRDNVQPSVFITNLARFQRTTGAEITVVSCEQKAKRTLCNGLSHKEFSEELKRLVEKQTDTLPEPQDGQELATTSSPMVQEQVQSSNGSFKYDLNTSDSETPSFSGWNLSDIHRPVNIQLRTDLNNSNESLSASPGTPLNLLHNHPLDTM